MHAPPPPHSHGPPPLYTRTTPPLLIPLTPHTCMSHPTVMLSTTTTGPPIGMNTVWGQPAPPPPHGASRWGGLHPLQARDIPTV